MSCITGADGAIGINYDLKMKPVLDQDNATWRIGFAGIANNLVLIGNFWGIYCIIFCFKDALLIVSFLIWVIL